MTTFEAIVLGLVQGLTEFLPVSSTGHLVFLHSIFGLNGVTALSFDAVLHLATAGAVIVYFWGDVVMLLNTARRKVSRLPVNERDYNLLLALLIGTVPAVIFGLLLENIMATLFRSPILVATVLIVGSFLFVLAEWKYLHSKRGKIITIKTGLLIGLFQCLALVPGMSRSGATISGGMLLGLSREESARFAFLLAIPIILGAGSKKMLELMTSSEAVSWFAVAAGAATAFFAGLAAIHFMLSFVRRYSLWPFIWYRVILATVVIVLVTIS